MTWIGAAQAEVCAHLRDGDFGLVLAEFVGVCLHSNSGFSFINHTI